VSLRVLHAIHDFLPRHRAGSEIYAFHLCREQASRHHPTVVCAEYDPARPHGSVRWRLHEGLPVVEIVNNWTFQSFEETYEAPSIAARLRHVLTATDPDVLHVHNLLNLSFDFPLEARRLGIPVVATLHDYTLLCPSGGQRVHVAEQHVCHVIDPERCARCFPQSPLASQMAAGRLAGLSDGAPRLVTAGRALRSRFPKTFRAIERRLPPGAPVTRAQIEGRLTRARHVFDAVDVFVAPSRALADEYLAAGVPADKLRVSDYGFVPLAPAPRQPGTRLRIGFVGTLVWHKGAHVLIEAVQALPASSFEVQIFGDVTVFPDYVARLRSASAGLAIEFKGGFDGRRTAHVYSGFDVLVVPSLWPENSPLVIHEAFMAGVPVVGARQGGIPELVTDGVNGLTYDAYSAADLSAALRRLLEAPDLLGRFAAALPPVKSIRQDAAEWDAIYRDLAGRRQAAAT
jgi:glycosyltransferase involved in cell wall biosynthesis